MRLTELWLLLPIAVAGAGLGLLFYGSLWYTVRRLTTTRRPALLLVGSLAVRTGLALLGLFLLMGGTRGHWERLLAACVGFLLARVWLTRQLGAAAPEQRG